MYKVIKNILRIENSTIKEKYSFRIFRKVKSLEISGVVKIPTKELNKIGVLPKIDQSIEIVVCIGEKKHIVFQGRIITIIPTLTKTLLYIERSYIDSKELNETFKNVSIEEVLMKISSSLQYNASPENYDQLVLKNCQKRSFLYLVRDKQYYINNNNEIVVSNMDEVGQRINITSYVVDARVYEFKVLFMPEIELNSIVEFRGIDYLVTDIVYEYNNKNVMILNVVRC